MEKIMDPIELYLHIWYTFRKYVGLAPTDFSVEL
jgi:hypothetical protein